MSSQKPRIELMMMRREKIKQLHERGYSGAEIGARLTPPVTARAVNRMLERMRGSGELK